MKIKLALALLVAAVSNSYGAVTLQFSSTVDYLSNFANAAGTGVASDGSNRMVWGIIVDTAGDGFDGASLTNPYSHGFALTAVGTVNGVRLSTTLDGVTNTLTDDYLFISSNLMAVNSAATPPDGSLTNMNRITNLSNINLNSVGNPTGVLATQAFAIVWFDALALSGTSSSGQRYGVFNPGGLTLPSDGNTQSYATAFDGVDDLKPMSYTLSSPIPEPSVALLGAFGVLGLLRRRR
jgi:hypothetical protein